MPGITELYRLKDDAEPLRLKLRIGYSGIGETTVILDGIRLGGSFQDSFETEFGPNGALSGKILEIRTYAGKIPPHTGQAAVLIALSGGYEIREYPMEEHSQDNPVVFSATFYLTF